MSYALGQVDNAGMKAATALAESTSLVEQSDGSIVVSTPMVVVSKEVARRIGVYTHVSGPGEDLYAVVSRANAQRVGATILADPWAAYQAGQALPGPAAAQVKASGIPIPQEGKRWVPWAIVGGGMALALGLVLMVSSKRMKPNASRRRSSAKEPVTKKGKYGTMYLYEIHFDEGGDPDPGEPPWLNKTRLYGYDRDHAIDRFYGYYYDINPGNSSVTIKSATRVMRYPK